MDIRRYFGCSATTKKNPHKTLEVKTTKKEIKDDKSNRKWKEKEEKDEDEFKIKKRKKATIIVSASESDEEDPIPKRMKMEKKTKSEEKEKLNSQSPKKTRNFKSSKEKIPSQSMVTAKDFFGSCPVQRNEKKIIPNEEFKKEIILSNKDVSEEMQIHDDDDFIETLKLLDCQEQLDKIEDSFSQGSSLTSFESVSGKHNAKRRSDSPSMKNSKSGETSKKFNSTPKKIKSNMNDTKAVTRSSPKKPTLEISPLPKQAQMQIENKSPASTEKEKNYTSYRNYLQRSGPQALGTKEIPDGTERCLQGLTFVITGVLESLERDDAADLIKKYKGKVTQSVSKNTNYIVVGREPGPSKLEKAEKLGTKQINEDELLDLIRKKSLSTVESPKETSKTTIKGSSFQEPVVNLAKKEISPKSKLEKFKNNRDIPINAKINHIKKLSTDDSSGNALSSSMLKEKNNPTDEALLWVEKYKPVSCKQIVGQQGDRSNMNKLRKWLLEWHKNNSGQQGKKKPVRWGNSSDNGSSFKAALLSGPPGIGKTTTATLVCQELGFSFTELNASDTRSKKSLQSEVQELLTNSSIIQNQKNVSFTSKHCLIMDEVDGMAGNEDRGGVQELIQLIKVSKIPVICMCNDRNHPKIRSLSNYCYDLRFLRPRVEQLKAAMMSLCYKENVNISPHALQEIIIAANQDVRQTIHHLSLWSVKDKILATDDVRKEAQKSKKDQKLNPFDTLKKVFSREDHKAMNIHDKTELFFYDYSIAPLFVQENYLIMKPARANGDQKKILNLISDTADSISDGDLIEKLIRSSGHWNLLPTQAIFASVIPGDLMSCDNVPHQVTFPNWLGKNSRRNKFDRMCQELVLHTRLKVCGNKIDLNLDYIPCLRDAIVRPLQQLELNGVHQAIKILQDYDILREDVDNILELSLWPGKTEPFSSLTSKVKAAFTRAYNSCGVLIPYASSSVGIKKQRVEPLDQLNEELLENGEESEEEEEEDNLAKDSMIKVKQPSKRHKKNDEPSVSKGKARSKKMKT